MMLRQNGIRVIAAVAAIAHAYFAYGETRDWGRDLVAKVAPKWLLDDAGQPLSPEHIQTVVNWAARLAVNVGIYNLMLAVGLAWVAVRGAEFASLGVFFAIWLLVAAWAAWKTDVVIAFYTQGVLGILLLAAAIWAGWATDS
jgi:uncharacterized membrane protein